MARTIKTVTNMIQSRDIRINQCKLEISALLAGVKTSEIKEAGYADFADYAEKAFGWAPATMTKYRTVGATFFVDFDGKNVIYNDEFFDGFAFSALYLFARTFKNDGVFDADACKQFIDDNVLDSTTSMRTFERLIKGDDDKKQNDKKQDKQNDKKQDDDKKQNDKKQEKHDDAKLKMYNALHAIADALPTEKASLVVDAWNALCGLMPNTFNKNDMPNFIK